ncbi:endonuclease III [Phaeovibrio sulfidiphilus]|uniref:Endonuclease III n=1 Tax=Phaeovibrio sulfidiphilus TaxID=1220600 RepID=A0A8J6YVH1_9PROT|nr:endonuclease III [Phaeovibrio sulfidiphilus]MBE1237154.1 endonuclease III [Phaeovibrio sulfidiphilus]
MSPSRLTGTQIRTLYDTLAQANPEPKGELDWTNPFTLLVAVVLSAQCTDKAVNKATAPVFQTVRSARDMLDLGEDRLRAAIAPLGFHNTKARNVIALSEILVREYGNEVPADREALESLPGVGRKTANVVLSIAFGQPTIAVDTHVFRVANRTGLAPGKTPLAVEEALLKVTPADRLHNAHHWLILHGRYVCKARKPDCPRCLIREVCLYPDKTAA